MRYIMLDEGVEELIGSQAFKTVVKPFYKLPCFSRENEILVHKTLR
jgi:hypothetical protein